MKDQTFKNIKIGLQMKRLAFVLIVPSFCAFLLSGCVSKVASRNFSNILTIPEAERGGKYLVESVKLSEKTENDLTNGYKQQNSVNSDKYTKFFRTLMEQRYSHFFTSSKQDAPFTPSTQNEIIDSIPLSFVISKTTKEPPLFDSLVPILSVGFIPWPSSWFYTYSVEITTANETKHTTFDIKKRTWFAWPPLGLIPVPGFGDVRAYLEGENELNLNEFDLFEYNCIVDAVVATLDRKKYENFVTKQTEQRNIEQLARTQAEKAAAERKKIEDLERAERIRKQTVEDERLAREQKIAAEQRDREQKIAAEQRDREQKIYMAELLEKEENLKRQARKDEAEWNKLLIAQRKPVVFYDSTWIVLEAKNMGSVLKPRNPFGEEAKTEGVFILVKYQVINTTKAEKRIIVEPVLVDSSLREFKTYDKQKSYFPVEGETITFEALPSSITRTYYGVYEVAKDSKEIVFRARSLETLTQDFKNIPLAFQKEK